MTSQSSEKRSRRDLLIGLGAIAAVGGGWQLWVRRPRAMAFQPIEGLPGWRKIGFDGVSSPPGGLGGAALLGLDGSETPVELLPAENLCAALFGETPPGKVPVAVFSDFYCPFCRVLIERLGASEDTRIAITWHELPLLGPFSVIAARAAIAAALQDRYVAFQSRMLGSRFRPSSQFLSETAEAVGLNGAQLVADMERPEVDVQLRQSRAASRTLGIWGTPAMVVGRTLVMGAVSEADLTRLIDIEAEAGPLPC